MQDQATLACTDCQRRNYHSSKNKKNVPDRMELRKYCRWCRKHKLVSPVYASRTYCSRYCAARAKSGPSSPSWKGGITTEHQRFYTSRDWKLACRDVWARERGCCERCGIRAWRGHEVHHHKTWAKHPTLRLDRTNLALLCCGCHDFVHSKRNTRREFL